MGKVLVISRKETSLAAVQVSKKYYLSLVPKKSKKKGDKNGYIKPAASKSASSARKSDKTHSPNRYLTDYDLNK